MNKEELQAKLDEAKKRRMEIGDNILWLIEQIAEAEKPKLRHGDFGLSWDNTFVVVEQDTLEGSPKAFFADTSGQQGADKNMPDAVIFGNIFDLMKEMKEWSKTFVSWESEPAYKKNGIRIKIETNSNGVFFGNSGNAATFELEDITKIWYKLGHAITELKRKENKCS